MNKSAFFDGRKIKKLRKEYGISVQTLSERADIPIRTLEEWESGIHEPRSISVLNQIAEVLDCSLNDFLADGKSFAKNSSLVYTKWNSYTKEDLTALIDCIKKHYDKLTESEKRQVQFILNELD